MRADIVDRLVLAGLDPTPIGRLASDALAEDLGNGVDVTSVACIPFDLEGVAEVRSRAEGVLAGLAVALAVIDVATGGHVEVLSEVEDATVITAGQSVLSVEGLVRPLLTAERTALNLVCHLSGIATATRAWVLALEGTGAKVRDTRKTTPGLRALEKYAVRCGGGVNHRMGLSDAALVKDNHVAAAGGVAAAFTLVRETFPGLAVEVECDTVEQVGEAVAAGADLVLLDNMSLEHMSESVALTKPAGVLTEASGGLTLANAADVGRTGVDFLAVGALTHSAPVLDLGFDLSPAGSPGAALVLLAVDVGNTNTVLGVFKGEQLVDSWRVKTDARATSDELALLYRGLLAGVSVTGISACSTVPSVLHELRTMTARAFAEVPTIFVEPGTKTGVQLHYDNPREVGADRIVNTLAAATVYGGPAIVVDFGTSTNFDVVGAQGEFLGGVLAPGIEISIDALAARGARLFKVELARPRSVVGKTTVEALQSGMVYGFAAQVDGLVRRLKAEIEPDVGPVKHVIATGGLASVVLSECETVTAHDPDLTLTGLRLVWEKNVAEKSAE